MASNMDRRDERLLRGLRERDLIALALTAQSDSAQPAALAVRLGTGVGRAKGSLRRLEKRGLIEQSDDGYRATDAGRDLGVAGLVARVMDDVVPDPRHVHEFVGTRLADLGGPKDRSEATGSPGVERDDELRRLVEIAMHDEWSPERCKAVAELGFRRDPGAVPSLVRLARDATEDDTIRAAAARALGRVGTPIALPPLHELASSGSSTVRRAAAEALGVLGDETAVPELIALLEYPTGRVREEAAEALGAIGDARAVPGLCRCLRDDRRMVRTNARRALVTIATDEAIVALAGDQRRRAMRRIDARDARRAQRWRQTRPLDSPPGPLDRMVWLEVGSAARWLLTALILIVGDVFVAGASPFVVTAAAVFAFGLGAFAVLRRTDESSWTNRSLDDARARAVTIDAATVRAAPLSIGERLLTAPVRGVLFVLLPIAVDWATGRLVVLASLVAGFTLNIAVVWLREAREIARWERTNEKTLFAEAARNPIPRRRFFVRDRHPARERELVPEPPFSGVAP